MGEKQDIMELSDLMETVKPKNILLVTHLNSGIYGNSLTELSTESMIRYCDKHGLDYAKIDGNSINKGKYSDKRLDISFKKNIYRKEELDINPNVDFDLGLIYHGCLCCYPEELKNIIENTNTLIDNKKLYLVQPEPLIDKIDFYLSSYYPGMNISVAQTRDYLQ